MEPDGTARPWKELGPGSGIRGHARGALAGNQGRNPVAGCHANGSGGGQGCEWEYLLDHSEHPCECRGTHTDARLERVCGIPDLCERCIFALPLVADDPFAPLERWLFAGGVQVLEIHRCNI